MTMEPITLTVGWIGRHTPPGAGVDGRDAAVIDIAQDLLLRDLHERGSLDALAFKGGTSLRKLYAGNQGRFSLDLDFSVADPASDADTVVLQLVSAIDGTTIGPFSYGVTQRRGKWSLTIQSPFGTDESTLSSKLDVSAPPWLEPVRRGWVRMPIHATYGLPSLPELQVVRLEENIAEKISRLNRTTTARDLYDLAWLVTHQRDIGDLDTELIRRMVVLKIWVDANGVTAGSVQWRAGHEPRPFDPDHWLRTRAAAEVDLADIGALAVPTPSLADLNATIQAHYNFLRELDPEERQLAATREQDRHLALRLLNEMPGARLASLGLYQLSRAPRQMQRTSSGHSGAEKQGFTCPSSRTQPQMRPRRSKPSGSRSLPRRGNPTHPLGGERPPSNTFFATSFGHKYPQPTTSSQW